MSTRVEMETAELNAGDDSEQYETNGYKNMIKNSKLSIIVEFTDLIKCIVKKKNLRLQKEMDLDRKQLEQKIVQQEAEIIRLTETCSMMSDCINQIQGVQFDYFRSKKGNL